MCRQGKYALTDNRSFVSSKLVMQMVMLMVSIGECVLSYGRLLRVAQATVAVVFTNAGTDTELRNSYELAIKARNSVHPAQWKRASDVFHRPQEWWIFLVGLKIGLKLRRQGNLLIWSVTP